MEAPVGVDRRTRTIVWNAIRGPMSVTTECLCLKLRMASRTMTALYDAVLQPTGLTSSQFSALRNIYRFEPSGLSELANVMLLERTTLSRNFDLLKERGLTQITRDPWDARIQKPALTPDGVAVLKSAIPRWRLAQRRVLSGLGAKGWAELQATLRTAAAINEEAPVRMYEFSPEAASWGAQMDDGSFEPSERQRCVNSTLRGAARHLTREYDAALRDCDLKVTQLHVLSAISENPNLRVTDLARHLSLDQASATLAVSGLRRRGWVNLPGAGKGGGRGGSVERGLALTNEGSAVQQRAMKAWDNCQQARASAGQPYDMVRWGGIFDKTLAAALRAKAN